ncbi:Uncharacterised protein [Klebsiella pneumoniae]|nr:Uncharacterised protein [Klebsiella pneumoniae]
MLNVSFRSTERQTPIGNFFAEIRRYHDNALCPFSIEHTFFQTFPAHKFCNNFCRRADFRGFMLCKIKLKNFDNAFLTKVGAVTRILQRLPDHVTP